MQATRIVSIVCACVVFAGAALGQDGSVQKQLDAAIRDGNLKQVRAVLAKGASVNFKDDSGTTPLMTATVAAGADCVKLLLERGADPNIGNAAGATALMWAVGDAGKVRLLLDRGASVNAISKDGNTALLLAAEKQNALEVVRLLLGRGADANVATKDGTTPLILSAIYGDVGVLKALIARGANPKVTNKNGLNVLNAAALSRSLEAVKLMIDLGVPISNHGGSILIAPVRTGLIEMTRLLISKGADVNKPNALGYTPLMFAVLSEDSSLELIKLLMDHGADVKPTSRDGMTALTFAKRKNWSEVVTLLTQAGAGE